MTTSDAILRYTHSEKGLASRRAWRSSPAGKASAEATRARWRAAHPDRARARDAVNNAVRSGRLVRPDTCSGCGKPGRVEGHHHLGYDAAHLLDVVWMCHACHWMAHGRRVIP